MAQVSGNDLLVLYTRAELTAFRDGTVSPMGQNKTMVEYDYEGRRLVKVINIPYAQFLPTLANALDKLGLAKNQILARKRAFGRFGGTGS